MKRITIFVGLILLNLLVAATILNSNDVEATGKTSSYNFCSVFPAYPECVGWRNEPITDNYWFCEYVHLKNLCKNPPDPEKQIQLRTQDYCCKYIGSELTKKNTNKYDQNNSSEQQSILDDNFESISPLIIWTDKDHYNYRDKVTVYGKFDFTNPTIIENIHDINFAQTGEISGKEFTIDVKLNGRIVLRDIPVSPNGWFSAFFFHNNKYIFSTQDNLLEVEYITTKEVPLGGPKTSAKYQFTTGDIAKKDEKFDLWIKDNELPNKIQYGVTVENSGRFIDLMRQDFVKTRLVTPSGYVIPIESVFSILDRSAEYDDLTKYGQGEYQIQVTYGNNISKEVFEYQLQHNDQNN